MDEIPQTCPRCLGVDFQEYPQGSERLRCRNCGEMWHVTDLTGERFEYLRGTYAGSV